MQILPAISPISLAEHGPPMMIGGAVAGVIALALVVVWFKAAQKKRTIENVPTSKVQGVAIGLTELKGALRLSPPLTTYLAATQTVWYSWSVSEQWRKTVTERYTDSDGKRKTRTKTETGWTQVAGQEERVPFYLEDDTGTIRIDPTAGTLTGVSVFDETVGQSDPLYYGKGPTDGIAHSTGTRHFSESALLPDKEAYVMGSGRLRQDKAEPEIAYDEDDGWLIITHQSEQQVAHGFGWTSGACAFFGAVLAGLCSGLVGGAPPFAAIGIAAFALLLIAGYGMLVYNGLIRVRIRMAKAWTLIDIQLKRRANLIPQIAEVARAYAEHEASLQTDLVAIRGGSSSPRQQAPAQKLVAETADAANQQTHALNRLLAIREAYPALKADAGFTRLHQTLTDTEDRIALARAFFNDATAAYNKRLQTLPDALIARPMGLTTRRYFEIEPLESQSRSVSIHDASV